MKQVHILAEIVILNERRSTEIVASVAAVASAFWSIRRDSVWQRVRERKIKSLKVQFMSSEKSCSSAAKQEEVQQLQNANPAEFGILHFLDQLIHDRRRSHNILLGDQHARRDSVLSQPIDTVPSQIWQNPSGWSERWTEFCTRYWKSVVIVILSREWATEFCWCYTILSRILSSSREARGSWF